MNWSEDDLAAIQGRLSRASGVPGRRPPSPNPVEQRAGPTRSPAGERPATNKYHAAATTGPDGMGGTRRYPSKREARAAERLEQERSIGGIAAWLPQVGVTVGNVGGEKLRHVVDFLVIVEVEADGKTFRGRFVEAKGRDLLPGRRKRRALEALTGCKVELV